MIKRVISYTNFQDEPVEKECWFHMSRYETEKFDAKWPGGFSEYSKYVIEKRDGDALFELLEALFMSAYGIRTADGLFLKDTASKNEFRYGGAFDQLMIEVLDKPEELTTFLAGVFPKAPTGAPAPPTK